MVDQELLMRPTPNFALFHPTAEKMEALIKMFMERPLWMSDEFRTEEEVRANLIFYCGGSANSLFYEYGDFKAVVGLSGIAPGWKANVTFKLIDRTAFGRPMMKEGRRFLDTMMDAFKLRILHTETPDKTIAQIAEICQFNIDGARPLDFMWHGDLYDVILMSRMSQDVT
jgi:hypothetical protein